METIDKKAVCILGGMGPSASAYLYQTLIKISIAEYGVKNNDQFPEIILDSVPVPDFISDDKNREKALKMLQERVNKLKILSINSFSIACNTAHILLPQLLKLTTIPFISMIDEVVRVVENDKLKKIGLISTPSTLKYGLYQTKLQEKKIAVIMPEQIHELEKIIRRVIKGEILLADQVLLRNIANTMKKQGAKGIILGCTELPLVFPKEYSLPVYNSVEILARALLRKYYQQAVPSGNKQNTMKHDII